MDITSVTQEVAETSPEAVDYRNVRQRALAEVAEDATELCIIIQYNSGTGVMRCLVEEETEYKSRNVPGPIWKAVEWMDGYVERDTPEEGGMVRYVVGPVNFEDARRKYKEEYHGQEPS